MGLNHGPPACEAGALPLSYTPGEPIVPELGDGLIASESDGRVGWVGWECADVRYRLKR